MGKNENVIITKSLLERLLNYMEYNEKNHYLENPTKDHIYVDCCKLKKEIKENEKEEKNFYKYIIVGSGGNTYDLNGSEMENQQVLDYCYNKEEALESLLKIEDSEEYKDVDVYRISKILEVMD